MSAPELPPESVQRAELAAHAKITAAQTGYMVTPNRFTQALGQLKVNGVAPPHFGDWVAAREAAGNPVDLSP